MGRPVTSRQERPGRRGLSRRARRRLSAALVVTLLLAAAGGWTFWSARQAGEAAPAFTLPASTGDMVRLEDYRGKQPVVLVFYMVGT